MENLPKDVLVLLAMEMGYADVLRFCTSSKRINRLVCENENFWRNKLYQTYPFSKRLQEKFTPITNYREFYRTVEQQIKQVTTTGFKPKKLIGFNLPSYIAPNLSRFLMQADIGVIPDTQVPLNYILWPVLKENILTRVLATKLLGMYLTKYRFIENGKKYLRTGPDMETFLYKEIEYLEKNDTYPQVHFNRNKFVIVHVQNLLKDLFIRPDRENMERLSSFSSTLTNIDEVITKSREIARGENGED